MPAFCTFLQWLVNDLTSRCRSLALNVHPNRLSPLIKGSNRTRPDLAEVSRGGNNCDITVSRRGPDASVIALHGASSTVKEQHCGKGDKSAYPLDFHALCPVHVVAFTVCGVIVSVCCGGWLKVLGILCQLEFFGLLP